MKTDLTVAGYIFRKNSFDFRPELLLIQHRKLDLWLPAGGHIDRNETPPEAMVREAREEVGLTVKLLRMPQKYATVSELRECAIPFYSNVHNVGDHNHYCQFYICEAPGDQIARVNEREILMARWFTQERLENSSLNFEKNNLVYLAFKKYEEIKNALG